MRIAAATLLLMSISTVVTYVVRVGTGELPTQVARILLTAGLGYALTQGLSWARWLAVLSLLGGMFVVVPVFRAPDAFSGQKLTGTLVLLALFVTYGILARGLLYSDSVRAFFHASNQMSSLVPRK